MFTHFERLYSISDLHLGGKTGFQIFNADEELASFINRCALEPALPPSRQGLVINGDMVDFLASDNATYFDPYGASAKFTQILQQPEFEKVWSALRNYVSKPGHVLIINLGNHDLELVLPQIREQLITGLTAGNSAPDEATRGRIILAFDGAGFSCTVGPARARVLCLHGNEVDSWNVTDFNGLKNISRSINRSMPVADFSPNAGTQLVVDVMNQVKKKYQWVDLLKPEDDGVISILYYLAPETRKQLMKVAALWAHAKRDSQLITQGLLSGSTSSFGSNKSATSSNVSFSGDAVLNQILTKTVLGKTESNSAREDDILNSAWQRIADGKVKSNESGLLGVGDFFNSFVTDSRTGLRGIFNYLLKDKSFDISAQDETYNQINQKVGMDVHFTLVGHTHLHRAIQRNKGMAYYFNSGTWVNLMHVQGDWIDPARFDQVFTALVDGSMAVLKRENLLIRRFSVVRIQPGVNGDTVGELCEYDFTTNSLNPLHAPFLAKGSNS